MEARRGDSEARDSSLAKARAIVQALADTVPEARLRERFLKSRAVREL
jgi:hypothetical protein